MNTYIPYMVLKWQKIIKIIKNRPHTREGNVKLCTWISYNVRDVSFDVQNLVSFDVHNDLILL